MCKFSQFVLFQGVYWYIGLLDVVRFPVLLCENILFTLTSAAALPVPQNNDEFIHP